MKSKTYYIFGLIGYILLFYNIWEIKPVTVVLQDFLGLASKLTVAYWIGYAVMIISSIKLYLDKDVRSHYLYLFYLIIIGLYLFGVPVLAEDNARFAWSYYPTGEVRSIIEDKKIDKISEYPLLSYRSWPTAHIVSSFMIVLANVKIDDLIKYMPIFWMLALIFITYSVAKLFKLETEKCFLVSLFVLSSFWTLNYYYGPPSLGYILYLLFFVPISLLYRQKNMTNAILSIVIYGATVVTHMLTSIALVLSLLFSIRTMNTIFKYRLRLMTLLVVIFIGWYIYVAVLMFNVGVKDFVRQIILGEMLSVFESEKYNSGESLMRQIIHFTRISYLGTYGIFVMLAAYYYIRNDVIEKYKELLKLCFYWLTGLATLLIFRYGAEIDDRVYIYSLLPMSLIIIMTFNKKIVSILAILLMILHIPAHYGTESFDMIYTSELKGSEFIASKIGNYDSVNYYYPLLRFYNPELRITAKGFVSGIYSPNNVSLDSSNYVIHSVEINNQLMYVYGTDEINNWINESYDSPMLFYDNGYYRIYKNI